MTKIVVISANGRIASHVTKELVAREHDTTGFGRKDENTTDAQTYIKKDLFELTKAALADFSTVISAFGTWKPETLHLHVKVIYYLTSLLSDTDKRLVIIGGESIVSYADHALAIAYTIQKGKHIKEWISVGRK